MNPRISVVVCTRNRASQLAEMFDHYEAIETSVPWELVLVDNGSTDATPDVIRQFASQTSLDVQRVTEPRPGASRGRNKGWRAARGEIIAFADDDCYPRNDFIAQLDEVYKDERVAYSGSRVLLFDASDYPITILPDETRRLIAPRTIVEPGSIHGANMAIRSKVLEETGGFDEMLGAGTPYSCEDIDLLTRVSFLNYEGVYDPRPVIYHHHRRKAGRQVERLMKSYDVGRGAYYMKCTLDPALRPVTLRNLYWQARGTPWRTRLANARSTLYESYGATRYLLHRLGRRVYTEP